VRLADHSQSRLIGPRPDLRREQQHAGETGGVPQQVVQGHLLAIHGQLATVDLGEEFRQG
jgi:hypothetical protein